MFKLVFLLFLNFLFLCFSATIDHKKTAHIHKHEHGEDHDPTVDHEAFLGKDAKSFNELTPEESKAKLKIIIKLIDKDANGEVSEEELINWVKGVSQRYIEEDSLRHWTDYLGEKAEDKLLTWVIYKNRLYGEDFNENSNQAEFEESQGYNYKSLYKKDQRRWKMADKNEDGVLSLEEFKGFLHPEEFENMQDINAIETLEELDKDKDGKVSLSEYLTDLWPKSEEEGEDDEPHWVKRERELFKSEKDKNQDGFLDKEEVKGWISPSNYDQNVAEAKHLIYEADTNKDGKLNDEEILNNYEVFVGSQATDFGEELVKHDEF